MADEHISPGFLTPSAAEYLKRAARQVEDSRQQLANRVPTNDEKDFPAVITSGSGGYHAWTEQWFDATGARYTKPGGRTGTTSVDPACLPDRSTIAAGLLPFAVWLRRTIWDATYGVIYEIISDSIRGLSVTDGTTTVAGVTALTLSPDAAWTISGATPNATATINDAALNVPGIVNTSEGQVFTGSKSIDGSGISGLGLIGASSSGIMNSPVGTLTAITGFNMGALIGTESTATVWARGLNLSNACASTFGSVATNKLEIGPSSTLTGQTFTFGVTTYSSGTYDSYKMVMDSPNAVFADARMEAFVYASSTPSAIAVGGFSMNTVCARLDSTSDPLQINGKGFCVLDGSLFYQGLDGSPFGINFVNGLYTGGTPAVNLATEVTGTLVVGNGGTGATSFTAGQLLAGNGTSPLDSVTGTRVVSEKLEVKLGTDSWIDWTEGSF